VQPVLVPAENDVAAHVSDVIAGAAAKATLVVLELPFRVALTVAVPSEAGVPTVAENLPVLEPEGTVTVAGTIRSEVLLERAITAPSAGAGLLSPKVQLPCPPASRLPGLQPSDATVTAAGVNVNVRETYLI
jgi:hypothetical protein